MTGRLSPSRAVASRIPASAGGVPRYSQFSYLFPPAGLVIRPHCFEFLLLHVVRKIKLSRLRGVFSLRGDRGLAAASRFVALPGVRTPFDSIDSYGKSWSGTQLLKRSTFHLSARPS
jgi:hypothetical protein